MEEQASLDKRAPLWLFKMLLGAGGGLACMVCGVPAGTNWNAEKKAESFCRAVKSGADMAAMFGNFEKALSGASASGASCI
ncbi:MAG TPA: hypothetical protein VF798_07615, partial [Burkholderiaceae bacterium]